jgi:hypothetical protein
LPAFFKSPAFLKATGVAILAAWVVWIIYKNLQLDPIRVHLIPFTTLNFNVSLVIIGSAIFGSIATIVIQHYWRRWRSSKNAVESPAASVASSRTVA